MAYYGKGKGFYKGKGKGKGRSKGYDSDYSDIAPIPHWIVTNIKNLLSTQLENRIERNGKDACMYEHDGKTCFYIPEAIIPDEYYKMYKNTLQYREYKTLGNFLNHALEDKIERIQPEGKLHWLIIILDENILQKSGMVANTHVIEDIFDSKLAESIDGKVKELLENTIIPEVAQLREECSKLKIEVETMKKMLIEKQ